MLSSVVGLLKKPSAGGCNHDVLALVRAQIGDRGRLGGAVELVGPDFLTGLGVEGAKTGVVSGGDENQSAGGRDGPPVAGASGVLKLWREGLGDPQRDSPNELARIDVHCGQLAPRRLLAGQLLRRASDIDAEAPARARDALVGAIRFDAVPSTSGACATLFRIMVL